MLPRMRRILQFKFCLTRYLEDFFCYMAWHCSKFLIKIRPSRTELGLRNINLRFDSKSSIWVINLSHRCYWLRIWLESKPNTKVYSSIAALILHRWQWYYPVITPNSKTSSYRETGLGKSCRLSSNRGWSCREYLQCKSMFWEKCDWLKSGLSQKLLTKVFSRTPSLFPDTS